MLDRMLWSWDWIWLGGMLAAVLALVRACLPAMEPGQPREPTLVGLLFRYATYSAIAYAIAGMLGLSIVVLVTSQLAYNFVEARRQGQRGPKPGAERGIDDIWFAEP